ncbi:MAG: hypothetical protein EOO43_03830 [Flavobacterium sp.]|nr:MAG: hypothetical protein EOO43_03830 [Flavobacterium sp.]
MRILFLTTHNLATNPRLVKEMRLALDNKYSVEVICFSFDNWSSKYNNSLLDEFSAVKFHIISATRKPFIPWLTSVLLEKFSRLCFKIFRNLPISLIAFGVSRRSLLLERRLKDVTIPDIVVAHNPGSLWATLKAKQRFSCKIGFDVEDYHPGEGNNRLFQSLSARILELSLPKMDYVTFASPLIQSAVSEIVDSRGKNWKTVLNYFSSPEFSRPISIEGPLKMIWFSQHIDAGRGLELIFPVIKMVGFNYELHLVGNLNKGFYQRELLENSNIVVHSSMSQNQLHDFLKEFDIGLALEDSANINRDICLTNKILSYLQAGLFILATNTKAQSQLLKEYNNHGIIFKNSVLSLKMELESIALKINSIRERKNERYESFLEKNWESESAILLNLWDIK